MRPKLGITCAWLAAALLGAFGGEPPRGFRLYAAVEEARAAEVGLSLPEQVEVGEIELDTERRRGVATLVEPWSWTGRVPRGARFSCGVQLLPHSWEGIDRLEVVVTVAAGDVREVVAVGRSAGAGWLDVAADLSAWEGREISLTVRPELFGPGAEARRPRRLAWSHAALSALPEEPSERPNIVFILIDTLRADRLTPYGYERPTSPEIQRHLADRGVVVEHAYSQAPWTLPSMVSLMTSRFPGDVLKGGMAAYGIPDGVSSMAERLEAEGYETAAFLGNFTLRDGNGFGRGFHTRYSPPPAASSNYLSADSINARAIPWLENHQRRPFFLYVHYMDPHDPYASPELVDGKSPFYPDYPGGISGEWVHGIYLGRVSLDDPEADLAHLSALYDSELSYVDHAVGELLSALDPEVARETLFVLTSDHGEELFEHGGFKHGQSLYEEQIHVPLIFRWDGRLPAGTRLGGTVSLIDVLPTVAAAAGAAPEPAWQGSDLLPALAGREELPRRPAFAQHLASGPLRATAIFGGKKLVLFNRQEPFAPANGQIEYLWSQDLGRLEAREVYDLDADPGELDNLADGRREIASALERVIHHRLDTVLPGLKVLVAGLEEGATLSGSISFESPPESWQPYFLGEKDRVRLEGRTLSFEFRGDGFEKGVVITGEARAISSIQASVEGSSATVLVGSGRPYRGGGPVSASDLLAEARPARPATPGGAALLVWERAARSVAERAGDPEVARSLETLGYIE